jgi:cell division protease FtsH
MTGASDSEAREFAAAFRGFLDWVHADSEDRNEVAGLVEDFLGDERSGRSVVTRSLPAFEHVNLLRVSAPPLVDLPNGPGSTLACLRLAHLKRGSVAADRHVVAARC